MPVAPLDPGVPLGDLLPPTELTYTPPEFHEIGQVIERNDAPLIVGSAIAVSEEGLANAVIIAKALERRRVWFESNL